MSAFPIEPTSEGALEFGRGECGDREMANGPASLLSFTSAISEIISPSVAVTGTRSTDRFLTPPQLPPSKSFTRISLTMSRAGTCISSTQNCSRSVSRAAAFTSSQASFAGNVGFRRRVTSVFTQTVMNHPLGAWRKACSLSTLSSTDSCDRWRHCLDEVTWLRASCTRSGKRWRRTSSGSSLLRM